MKIEGIYSAQFNLQANALSLQLNLPLLSHPVAAPHLIIDAQGIWIKTAELVKPFQVDFLHSKIQHRIHSQSKELVTRACGIAANKPKPRILDCTAGWGLDGYVLASAGGDVTLLEQSNIVYALLADGIRRLKEKTPLTMQVIHADAMLYLEDCPRPEVVYCDPMWPAHPKQLKHQKSITLLQHLVSPTAIEPLIEKAWAVTTERLVVKKPKHDKTPLFKAPSMVLEGKQVRFFVFLKH